MSDDNWKEIDGSEEKQMRYFVTNHQNQPLELHLAAGVMVVGPREEAELQASDLDSPQLEALRKKRLLTTRKAEGSDALDASKRATEAHEIASVEPVES